MTWASSEKYRDQFGQGQPLTPRRRSPQHRHWHVWRDKTKTREGRILDGLRLNGQSKYWLNNRTRAIVFRHPRIDVGIMTLFGDPSLRLPTHAASER